MSSDGKFIYGDRVFTCFGMVGEIVSCEPHKTYMVQVGERVYSFREDELGLIW